MSDSFRIDEPIENATSFVRDNVDCSDPEHKEGVTKLYETKRKWFLFGERRPCGEKHVVCDSVNNILIVTVIDL